MLFNSYVFLGAFLPLILLGYFGLLALHRRAALCWVVLGSLVFYGYWDVRFIPLICGSIAANYLLSRIIAKNHTVWPLVIGVAVNLGVLGFFKYSLFVLDVAGIAESAPDLLRKVILPLGISFWTFQQIAYLVDVNRGRVAPAPIDAHAFSMLFFPHLIAGPILLYVNISRQYLRHSWPSGFLLRSFQVGVLIFAIGLFKKVGIADSIAPFAEPVFDRAATQTVSPSDAWIGAIAYSLQLYFDFSGYSDMAYGLARMFGFRIPVNFLSPYKAVSILDFWQRWHRSL
ncbi:MAG: MBOAT family protein, partial [Brucellaceae bacterium]|nr:MBOAT family protein [Brucellaceae bacterium]